MDPVYDAEEDARKLAEPMRKWARMGFMRGFAGSRGEVLPKGRLSLPSGAFLEAATSRLGDCGPDEMARRMDYVEAVCERLREEQTKAVADHYRKAAWGRVADFAVAVAFAVIAVGLVERVGPDHPVTLVLLALIGVKLVFMHFSVRRMIRIAQSAFRSEPDAFVMPWEKESSVRTDGSSPRAS